MLIGTRYHTCGTEIKVVWKWNGLAYVLYQIDEQGEVTGHDCLGCGEYMYENEILTTPPAELEIKITRKGEKNELHN